MLTSFITYITLVCFLASDQDRDTGDIQEQITNDNCLECHGDKNIVTLSSRSIRNLLLYHQDDVGKPLLSDDAEVKKRLYIDRKIYNASVHKDLQCIECHPGKTYPGHRIAAAKGDAHWISSCGSCHEKELKTYYRTFHGKFRNLGKTDTAFCTSCHGTHYTASTDVIWNTCNRCHEGAENRFFGFRGHLNPLEDTSNPALFITAWFLRILFACVLGFFCIHSVLFFIKTSPRLSMKIKIRKTAGKAYVMRFRLVHRIVHLLLIISFMGSCLSGLPIMFASHQWIQEWVSAVGGVDTLRITHRCCAGIVLIYAALHLYYLWSCARDHKRLGGSGSVLKGPNTMIPNKTDFIHLKKHILWFFGRGYRPSFGHFSYLEKFDYWAAVWGVSVLMLSGLMIWFPQLFSAFLPGSNINWAMIVHSEEALLAVCFVFAIHFFHVHFRPCKFPMNLVIFTGRAFDSKTKEKPSSEELGESAIIENASTPLTALSYIFGFAMLILGLAILITVILMW